MNIVFRFYGGAQCGRKSYLLVQFAYREIIHIVRKKKRRTALKSTSIVNGAMRIRCIAKQNEHLPAVLFLLYPF